VTADAARAIPDETPGGPPPGRAAPAHGHAAGESTRPPARLRPVPGAGQVPGPGGHPPPGFGSAEADGAPPPRAAPGPDPLTGPVPHTERAVIGDELRIPAVWCELTPCIARHLDPVALGEADARARAVAAGWRVDALGRLTCPTCQQRDPRFRGTRPVVRWQRDPALTRAALMVAGFEDGQPAGGGPGGQPAPGGPDGETAVMPALPAMDGPPGSRR
jgi:hypothetical protein